MAAFKSEQTVLRLPPEVQWSDLPVRRPRDERPGAILLKSGRVFARGFESDYLRSGFHDIQGEDRYVLDCSSCFNDPKYRLRPGDTLIYIGKFEEADTTSVCVPGRVLEVDRGSGRWTQVLSILDTACNKDGEEAVERTDVPTDVYDLVEGLALTGAPATSEQLRFLGRYFLINDW